MLQGVPIINQKSSRNNKVKAIEKHTLYLCLLLGFGAEVAGVLACTILEPPTAALGDWNSWKTKLV